MIWQEQESLKKSLGVCLVTAMNVATNATSLIGLY